MEQDIPAVVKHTAKNMYELLIQLSAHIEKIEAENKTLKEENERLTRSSDNWEN